MSDAPLRGEAQPVDQDAPVTQRPEEPGLGAAAAPVSMATLGSRLLGVVREQVMATLFGAGNAADAFNIAFRVPNLLRDLFAEGALSASFVPTFTQAAHKEGQKAAWELGAQVVNTILIGLSLVVIVVWFFAPALVRIMAPGFAQVPGKLELTTLMARVMLPFLPLVALAAAAMGMLNSMHRFGAAALSPIWFNIGSIVVTLAMVPVMHALGAEPILAMAVGVLAGALLQLAVQIPPLWKLGFRPTWPPRLGHPGVKRVATLMWPAAIGLSAVQINVVINSWLASTLGTGAVSWLAYAFRILFVPIGLFGTALATVSLPSFSRFVAAGDMEGFKQTLGRAVRLAILLGLPAAVFLVVLSRPLTALLYQHGLFTAHDTVQTANALMAYCVGLAAFSGIRVLVPAFYALGDTKTPLVASFLSVAVNLALNLWLMRVWGHVGLALSLGFTSVFNFAQLWLWMKRRVGNLGGHLVLTTTARAAVACALMGGVLYLLGAWGETWPVQGWLSRATVVGLGVVLGGGLVIWLYGVFGISERDELVGALTAVARRFRGR
ncbi:MAG TPA: murein biosynthesis integral membrane protein MurJ [Candidatus Eisenbacteria bacterium]|nr:murein biosynthesis integral membrane protein MurJ [Candidatus Eisenbacteria bacterium]